MLLKYVAAGAALMSPAVAAASAVETKIITAADGAVWYLQPSSVAPLNLGRAGIYQFWMRSDNPAGQAIPHWSVRVYIYCETGQYVPSMIIGYGDDGQILQRSMRGWARENWRDADPNGAVGAASKLVCQKS